LVQVGRRYIPVVLRTLLAGAALVCCLAVPASASAMLSRFSEEPFPLHDDGRSLVTTGPVDWDPGEERAFFFVVVRQGSVLATGVRLHEPPSDTWSVPVRVRGHGRLHAGPAFGIGTAVVLEADGDVSTRVWSATITLQ
jgi:hypothetical protein